MLRRKVPFCLRQQAGLSSNSPPQTLLERRGPRTFLRSKQSNMGQGAATMAAFGAVPAAPVPRFPASTTAPTIRNGAVSSRDGPVFVSLMIWLAGLRGRAPFSCGQKRALPLKLPLPPKTAHGKARSTRLPSFRAKKRKEEKRQQKCRPKGVRHTTPQQSSGGNSAPDHAVHPGDLPPHEPPIQPQVSLNAPGQHFLKGGRKRTLKDFGVRGKALRLPGRPVLSFPLPAEDRP